MRTPFTDILNYVTSSQVPILTFRSSPSLQKDLDMDVEACVSDGVYFALQNNFIQPEDIFHMFEFFLHGHMGENFSLYKESDEPLDLFSMRGVYYPDIALVQYRLIPDMALTIQYLHDETITDGIDGFCMCFALERNFWRTFVEELTKRRNAPVPDSMVDFLKPIEE